MIHFDLNKKQKGQSATKQINENVEYEIISHLCKAPFTMGNPSLHPHLSLT